MFIVLFNSTCSCKIPAQKEAVGANQIEGNRVQKRTRLPTDVLRTSNLERNHSPMRVECVGGMACLALHGGTPPAEEWMPPYQACPNFDSHPEAVFLRRLELPPSLLRSGHFDEPLENGGNWRSGKALTYHFGTVNGAEQ